MSDKPALSAALVAAAKELTNPTKARTASIGQYSYTYADLSDVLEHVRPVLAKHDLVVTQDTCIEDNRLCVYTDLRHASGESLRFGPLSGPIGNTWQIVGSAITYARRYALLSALGLAAEDDDAAAASEAPETPKKGQGLRPVATDQQLNYWASAIRDAKTLQDLEPLTLDIRKHDLGDAREFLLEEYAAREQEIREAMKNADGDA